MRVSAGQQSCEASSPSGPVVFTWAGVVGPDDVKTLFEEVRKQAGSAPLRLLWDMSRAQIIPGETRQRFLDELVQLPVLGTAVVTSSFYVRVPITMVLEVASLEIEGNPPYRFFDSNEEALAWLGSLTTVEKAS